MVAHRFRQKLLGDDEYCQRSDHAVAHFRATRGADEDAVELKAPHRDQWRDHNPRQETRCRHLHIRDAGEQCDDALPRQQIDQRKSAGEKQRPLGGYHHHVAQRPPVAFSHRASDQRLGGVGEPVKPIAGE